MFQSRRVLAALLVLYACGRRRLHFVLIVGALAFGFYIGFYLLLFAKPNPPGWIPSGHNLRPTTDNTTYDDHPISHLIRGANVRFQELLTRRSFTIEAAASRYRERRGRHPPPGFDVWFAQAQKDGAVVIEEFFDRIHHDINPFWALEPKDMRMQANTQPQVIRVRNGKASFVTDDPDRQPWIQIWTELVNETMPHLPDLDMAVNVLDESRILVPWEKMNTYVKTEQANRKLIDPDTATHNYSGLTAVDEARKDFYDPGWITGDAPKYWEHLRMACPPDSAGRHATALASFDAPVDYPSEPLPYMFQGFIRNFTQAQNPCMQPHLRGMHGAFIESVSMSTAHDLFPMFGGSKLPQNNELLIPGAMYLSDRELYNGGTTHGPEWRRKRNRLIWRGTASGGRNKEDNWWHFHRHRWVQMMNGSVVGAMEIGDVRQGPTTFNLMPNDRYSVPAQINGRLGEWLSSFSDVAFVNLECFPSVEERVGIWPFQHTATIKTCSYTSPYMALKPSIPMKEQYKYKFLPDVDGNSFSGRWRAFLRSTSLPLKATIYTEWHDDRLIPWVHFVPFDNSYQDIYAVMDYFLNGHDREAETIATEGKNWVEMVYRRADMKLYVWRLLLEYARVLDDRRDHLAFVGDIH